MGRVVRHHSHAVLGRPDHRLVEADYTDFADDMKPVSTAALIERTTLIAHLKQFFHK